MAGSTQVFLDFWLMFYLGMTVIAGDLIIRNMVLMDKAEITIFF